MSVKILHYILVIVMLLSVSCSKDQDETRIVPTNGYTWPDNERSYWPTEAWQISPMQEHNINPDKMNLAHQFAQNDDLTRALLVIKDGYLVYENYYGDGGIEKSTNLWSVTKSVSSALVGTLIDDIVVSSTNQLMVDLLPTYNEFNDIKLYHALTHTTGLSWSETGQLWNDWIFSNDWVASALARGQNYNVGEHFKYSSGNSHFLTSLVYKKTGVTPGNLLKEHFFIPMGIDFNVLEVPINYTNWNQYKLPLHQTWRQDPMGIEIGGFGLYLTARDMAKFGYLYLNRGRWENQQLLSENWVKTSTKDQVTDIYDRYSYGYQWWITYIDGHPSFLASGFGGQIIGVVPSLDLVVVIKYEAEEPVDPVSGSSHDDMYLFELVVESVTI